MSLAPIIVLGASGFIGRHLLDDLKQDHRIFAIARRSQRECGAPLHANIAWMQVDIGNRDDLARTFREIVSAGGAETLLHLAAFYDFSGERNPEYERTNVQGTKNVLDLVDPLNLKRFVFASSVAACSFPRPEGPINEETPPDGDHIYAWSKRLGEEMVRERTDLRSVIVRFGATYSDWCEYPPLFKLMEAWLKKSWRSRILAGKGLSGIPYIHIRDVVRFLRRLIAGERELAAGEILIASTPGCSTHRRLFEQASLHFFGFRKRPILTSPTLCRAGLVAMDLWGRLVGKRPFERPWMARYIDRQMEIELLHTEARLGWSPSPRNHIERRVPFMIERLKSEPLLWMVKNSAAMRRDTARPDLLIHKALAEMEDPVVGSLADMVKSQQVGGPLPNYGAMERTELVWTIRVVYRLLLTSVLSSTRMLIRNYAEVTAFRRFQAGFSADEICHYLQWLNETILRHVVERSELRNLQQELYDRITMPIELAKDEVLEQYDRYTQGILPVVEPSEPGTTSEPTPRQLLEETIWNCLVQRK